MSKSRIDSPASREAGFTLIEVVIALAIAALGLGALMASASQGLRNVIAANVYIDAARRAQTHLDSVGSSGPPVAGEQSGDDGDGFRCRLTVAPAASLAPPKGSGKDGLTLYDVAVTISWQGVGGAARSISVQSERLGRLGK